MKKLFVLFALAVVGCLPILAQAGLNVNQLFDGRFKHNPDATEIIVTNGKAAEFGLEVYHSLSVTDKKAASLIETLAVKDGVKALDKEVEYRGGKLYYGYYVLAPKSGSNRFLFYLNQNLARKNPVNKVTLIYMQGDVSSKRIKKLIQK